MTALSAEPLCSTPRNRDQQPPSRLELGLHGGHVHVVRRERDLPFVVACIALISHLFKEGESSHSQLSSKCHASAITRSLFPFFAEIVTISGRIVLGSATSNAYAFGACSTRIVGIALGGVDRVFSCVGTRFVSTCVAGSAFRFGGERMETMAGLSRRDDTDGDRTGSMEGGGAAGSRQR